MQRYIGTKLINATPMTRAEYNVLRGWELSVDECGDDTGYLVEYVDGGKANTLMYAGYVSWSPTDVFDKAYSVCTGMSFGMAIEMLKAGKKVARKGWNGKGMWLILVPGSKGIRPVAGTPYSKAGITQEVDIDAHVDMYTAQGSMQPGWLASQNDMLATDWNEVE